LNGLETEGVQRMMTVSTILGGLAVLSVALECPVAGALFGAAAFWMIGHGA
jgi:hypothetical protein